MKLVKRDGKNYLIGTAADVGKALTKQARKASPVDFGWTLNRQADDASSLGGETYGCGDCHYNGLEGSFVNSACPECGSKNIKQS